MDGNNSPQSPDTPFEFDDGFQQRILAVLLRDPACLTQYRHLLKAGYFTDTTLRQLAEWLFGYFDAYGVKPSSQAMQQMVQAYSAASPTLAPYTTVFLNWLEFLYGIDLTHDLEFVKDQIHDFVEERELMLVFMRNVPRIKLKDQRKLVWDDFRKTMTKLAATAGNEGVSLIAMDAEERTAYLFSEEVRDCVTSLWPGFNHACGGYAKGELLIFAGSQNRGKSWCACHAAASAVAAGKRVLFESGEMSEKQVALRVYSILSGMTVDELKMHPDQLEAIIQQYRLNGGEIIVKRWYGAGLADIRQHIMSVSVNHEWVPDMLVVDYDDLFTGHDAGSDDNDYRESKRFYRGLRDLCVEYNVAGVVAAQLNRVAENKERPTAGDLAECYGKAAVADGIWMVCQTEEEFQMSQMRLYQAKNRADTKGAMLSLILDLARGKMQDMTPEYSAGPSTSTFASSGPPVGANPLMNS